MANKFGFVYTSFVPLVWLSFSPSILPSIGMETYHGLSGHMSYIFFSVERLVAALISFVNLPCTYTSGSLCSVNVFGERIVVRTGNRVLCARARVCISVVSITLHFSIAIRWKYPNRTRSENRLSSKSTHTHRTLIGAR